MMDSSELLVITGPIASGKSTIGFLVAEDTRFRFFPEDVDTSPLDREILARYYQAVEAFHGVRDRGDASSRAALERARDDVYDTQVHFIEKRSSILETIARGGIRAVVERHPWDDLHVFSRRNLRQGLLTAEQFESLKRLVTARIQGLPEPRVMVFLSAKPGNLRARIVKRGREQEKELLSPDNCYLEEIGSLYGEWYEDYPGAKARVPTDGLSEREVVARIVHHLKETGIVPNRQPISAAGPGAPSGVQGNGSGAPRD